MESRNKILDELKEISSALVKVDSKSPYIVSSTYFNSVAGSVTEKIKSGAEPRYYFTKDNPYIVPVDYFEKLPTVIIEKLRGEEAKRLVFEEMEGLSPFLNTISKKQLYTIPHNYFERADWSKKFIGLKQGKVISFGTIIKPLKYLVAAAIIGLLGIGLFLILGQKSSYNDVKSVQFSSNAQAVSQVKKLSEQEIVNFLKTTSPTENIVSITGGTVMKDKDIKTSVSKMSDKEIQQFLRENGEQDEM